MWRYIIVLVALACAVAGTWRPHDAAHRANAAGDCTIDTALDAEEQAFLTLINNHRAANGRGPLKVSYGLTRASAWKSKDMAQNAYFAHDDLTRTWVDRVRDCGYTFNTYLGENIAAGVPTAQGAFDLWKNSPGHNSNMLGANYTAIGIGRHYVPGSPYGWYWTTNFGGFDDGYVKAASETTPLPAVTPAPAAGGEISVPDALPGSAPAPEPFGSEPFVIELQALIDLLILFGL